MSPRFLFNSDASGRLHRAALKEGVDLGFAEAEGPARLPDEAEEFFGCITLQSSAGNNQVLAALFGSKQRIVSELTPAVNTDFFLRH